MVLQALCHLGQKHPPHTALIHQRQQFVQRVQGVAVKGVAAKIGDRAGGLVGGHTLSQAAQVFDQHHAQGRGQRPQLAQIQLTRFLVGAQKLSQQFFVKCAVGVRDKSPCDTINPRQARQWLIPQHWKRAKVTAWQPLVNFLELRFDQVKIVEQPLGCRADVVACAGLTSNVGIGFPKRANIALKPREEICCTPKRAGSPMRFPQTATMLCKTLQPENFGTNRWFDRAARSIKNFPECLGCLRNQGQQRGLGHALQHQASQPDKEHPNHQARHKTRGHEAMCRLGSAAQRKHPPA